MNRYAQLPFLWWWAADVRYDETFGRWTYVGPPRCHLFVMK